MELLFSMHNITIIEYELIKERLEIDTKEILSSSKYYYELNEIISFIFFHLYFLSTKSYTTPNYKHIILSFYSVSYKCK